MRTVYAALVVEPLARTLDAVVELAGHALEASAGIAERYATTARYLAVASRLVP